MTVELKRPVFGPSSEDDREAWLEARRQGVTASEIAGIAAGRGSAKRTALKEKLTGEGRDIGHIRAIEWGRAREQAIAEWITDRFGIEPNRHLMGHPDNPRHLATPDGYVVTPFGEVVTSQIKTAKFDLTPGGEHFRKALYADQVQWEMYVAGAGQALFVWEQHDDDWTNGAPTPLGPPSHVWIERDDARIAALVEAADLFLEELDAFRVKGLPPAGDIDPEMADLIHQVLDGRDTEAAGKAIKEKAWKALQALVKDSDDFTMSNDEATITWSTSTSTDHVVDEDAISAATPAKAKAIESAREALAKIADAQERLDERRAKAQATLDKRLEPFTKAVTVPGRRTLTVTKAR